MKRYISTILENIKVYTFIFATLLLASCILLIMYGISYYISLQPSKNKFDRRIEWEYFWEKDKNGECIIDLAEIINMKWDSAKYTQTGNSDILYFMRNERVVYYAEWIHPVSEERPGGVVFIDYEKIPTFYPHNAKFKAYKNMVRDDKDKYIYLKHIK